MSSFRPDIEGLRAIAVTAVVLFHMDIPWARSGYLGVDIFYVISGYLITGLLLREWAQTGRIDVADFYARRVRRILPALTLTVLAVCGLGAVLLSADGEQQSLGQTAVTTAAFVSNIFLWTRETGYFAAEAYTLPLLHTWTLAVEEQFYLVWPAVIVGLGVAARRSGVRFLPMATAGMASLLVLSLALSVAAQWFRPEAVFYLTPFRGWELAAGGLVAAAGDQQMRPGIAASLQFLGIAIIAGVLGLHHGQPVVGWASLALTGGTAMLLAAGPHSRPGLVYKVLTLAPLRALGRVSYGWYLWHWPFLSLARLLAGGRASLAVNAAMALLALAAAVLTWTFVERPVKTGRIGPFRTRRGALWAGAGMLIACAAAGAALWAWGERPLAAGSIDAALRRVQDPEKAAWATCPRHAALTGFKLQDCLLGDTASGRAIVLIGDSHAAHLRPTLVTLARTQHFALAPRSFSGCRPVVEVKPRAGDSCPAANLQVRNQLPGLVKTAGARGVIISAYWPRDARWAPELGAEVRAIRALGLKVVLLTDSPDFAEAAPICLAHRPAKTCGRTRSDVAASRAAQTKALQAIAATDPGVRVLDTLDLYCPGDFCPVMRNGEVLYHDHSHLSLTGALRIAPDLAPSTAWLLE